MSFPENFPWMRRPQGLGASMLVPQPALPPRGRIRVELVKDARAVLVMKISAPASQQPVHFRDDFFRRTPSRAAVEVLPELVPQLGLAFGVGSTRLPK